MSSSFTCNTCGLAFQTSAGQKEHMRSDWHRYNLKRRVAQLPSISLEVFNEKVNMMATADPDEGVSKRDLRKQRKEEIQKQRMELIRKAMEDQARKESHSEDTTDPVEEKQEDKEEDKEEDTEENETEQQVESEEALADRILKLKLKSQVKIPPTTCLFCKSRSFKTIEHNVNHMFKNHGLYIPEQKYLVDLPGLLEYLGEKVGLGNVCLMCNYQGKNVEAVRAHMESKRHCMIPYDTEDEKLEISEFYDFSASYGASEPGADQGADEEWEDVSGSEGESEDEDLDKEYLYDDGVQLHLPTGLKVGHRSLNRYFKQNLKPEKTLTEGQGTVISAETRHMVSVVDKKLLAVQKRAWKTEIGDKKRNDKRAAKFINNQPHFRDPLLQ